MRGRPGTAALPYWLALSACVVNTAESFLVPRWNPLASSLSICPPIGCHNPQRRAIVVVTASATASAQEVVIDVDSILDAEVKRQIVNLVQQRAEARWKGDYALADHVRNQMEGEVKLPDNFRIAIADVPRGDGGGSSWSLVYEIPVPAAKDRNQPRSVLHLAHSALGMAVSCAERGVAVPTQQLDTTVALAKEQLLKWSFVESELRLSSKMGMVAVSFDKLLALSMESEDHLYYWNVVETELTGRKAADAAFWFAIAGTKDVKLFSLLTKVCVKELERFGERQSCRTKDVMAIVERLAAAGVRDDGGLEEVVTRCLRTKSQKHQGPMTRSETFLDFHSDYCAVMIWNFSTRQRKQRSFLTTAAKHWYEHGSGKDHKGGNCISSGATASQAWSCVFGDPTRPLVVDVGCGMGVSLLGLASIEVSDSPTFDWCAYNFIGMDLSALTINYAKSITARWGLDEKLAFVVASADRLLEQVKAYPGPIKLILIQFPTPYRLPSNVDISSDSTVQEGGNGQLPKSVADGFMVTPRLLRQAASLLRKSQGELLLQSNCEDVAVWMRHTACQEAGFVSRDTNNVLVRKAETPTKRTLNWRAMGGERAIGAGWSTEPLLPPTGRTETEIACILNGTPVHRCLLTAQ